MKLKHSQGWSNGSFRDRSIKWQSQKSAVRRLVKCNTNFDMVQVASGMHRMTFDIWSNEKKIWKIVCYEINKLVSIETHLPGIDLWQWCFDEFFRRFIGCSCRCRGRFISNATSLASRRCRFRGSIIITWMYCSRCRCVRLCRRLVFVITISLWAFMCRIFAATIFRSWLSLWFIRCGRLTCSSSSSRCIASTAATCLILIAATVSILAIVRNDRRKCWIIFGVHCGIADRIWITWAGGNCFVFTFRLWCGSSGSSNWFFRFVGFVWVIVRWHIRSRRRFFRRGVNWFILCFVLVVGCILLHDIGVWRGQWFRLCLIGDCFGVGDAGACRWWRCRCLRHRLIGSSSWWCSWHVDGVFRANRRRFFVHVFRFVFLSLFFLLWFRFQWPTKKQKFWTNFRCRSANCVKPKTKRKKRLSEILRLDVVRSFSSFSFSLFSIFATRQFNTLIYFCRMSLVASNWEKKLQQIQSTTTSKHYAMHGDSSNLALSHEIIIIKKYDGKAK